MSLCGKLRGVRIRPVNENVRDWVVDFVDRFTGAGVNAWFCGEPPARLH
jgi:hypothetical protein